MSAAGLKQLYDSASDRFYWVLATETVPVRTVNRQCSSGLQAIADVVAAIKAGFYDIGSGGGLESMSINPMAWEGSVNPRVLFQPLLRFCSVFTYFKLCYKYFISPSVFSSFLCVPSLSIY